MPIMHLTSDLWPLTRRLNPKHQSTQLLMINNNIHTDLYIRLFPGRAVGRLVGRWLSRPQVENVNLRKTSTFHFSPSSPPTFTNRVEHMEPSRKSRSGSSIELYRSIDPREKTSICIVTFKMSLYFEIPPQELRKYSWIKRSAARFAVR